MDLIINFTPTGMIPTKEMTPHVPITTNEVIEDVHEAVEVGITMVHIHARDAMTGKPTYKAEVYADIITGIRKFASDLIIIVSVSGRLFKEFEKRVEPLQLDGNAKPDMGSLTLGSMNFVNEANINSPEIVQRIASEMKIRGILPELEVFDQGMVNYAKYLETKGFIKPPHYMNLIFGNIASAQANLMHIGSMIYDLPRIFTLT